MSLEVKANDVYTFDSFAHVSNAQNFFLDMSLFYIAVVIALGAYAWSASFSALLDSRISHEYKIYKSLREILSDRFNEGSSVNETKAFIKLIDGHILGSLKLGIGSVKISFIIFYLVSLVFCLILAFYGGYIYFSSTNLVEYCSLEAKVNSISSCLNRDNLELRHDYNWLIVFFISSTCFLIVTLASYFIISHRFYSKAKALLDDRSYLALADERYSIQISELITKSGLDPVSAYSRDTKKMVAESIATEKYLNEPIGAYIQDLKYVIDKFGSKKEDKKNSDGSLEKLDNVL